MALVALRGEHGSETLLMRLRTSVYLVFLALDDAVSPDASIDLCVEAERVLDASVARAAQSGELLAAPLDRMKANYDRFLAAIIRAGDSVSTG